MSENYTKINPFELNIGDVVVLRSGGIPATVVKFDPYGTMCNIMWAMPTGELCEVEVPFTVLFKIEGFDLQKEPV